MPCYSGVLLHAGILRQDESLEELILPELPKNSSIISEVEGKAALIWILGEYGEVREMATIIGFIFQKYLQQIKISIHYI